MSWPARLLAHRRLIPVVAMAACAPALLGGIELDDVFHALRSTEPGFLDSAFTFIDLGAGDGPRPAHLHAADMPWWTSPDLHIDLWRPLAAVTHWLDYRMWPRAPWAMHLHSVLWYGLLVALVLRAQRAFGGAPARASLATLLFGLAQAHGMNVGWVSARNSLVSTALVFVTLLIHRRWRAEGWRAGAVLGPLVFGAALLANEGAVAGLGYLVAFAVVLDERRHRLTALLPYLGVAIVWRLVYSGSGHGMRGSAVYLDPLADPLVYAGRTVVHGTVMLAGSFGVAGLDGLGALPGATWVAFVVALPWLALLGWAARGPLRRDASLRMWTLGAVLCCFTAGTQVPTDRGLLMLHLGTYPLLAALVLRAWDDDASRPARWLGRGLLILHLGQSLLLPLRVGTTRWIQGRVDVVARALPHDPSIEPRMVLLLNAPSDLVMLYFRAMAQRGAQPFPARLGYLYAGAGQLTVHRTAAWTLELHSTRPWLVAPLDRMLRADVVFEAGQRIETPCMDVEILATDAASLPVRVRVQLWAERDGCEPLPMAWRGEAPEPIELPAIGESLTLDAVTLP